MSSARWLRAVAVVAVLALAACTPGANEAVGSVRPGGSSAGFLLGLWHGITLPIMFVISLFKDTVGIYEVHNTGWPYNLGFVLGVMSATGGAGAGARRRKANGS